MYRLLRMISCFDGLGPRVSIAGLCLSSLSLVSVARLCLSSLSLVSVSRLCRSSLSLVSVARLSRSSLSLVSVARLCLSSLSLSSLSLVSLSRLSLVSLARLSRSAGNTEPPLRLARSIHHLCSRHDRLVIGPITGDALKAVGCRVIRRSVQLKPHYLLYHHRRTRRILTIDFAMI